MAERGHSLILGTILIFPGGTEESTKNIDEDSGCPDQGNIT
jgi:hypothetical protein